MLKSKIINKGLIFCGQNTIDTYKFEELLPNGKKYNSVYLKDNSFANSDLFIVQKNITFRR